MKLKQLVFASLFILLILAFFLFDLGAYFNLEFFQQQRENILAFKNEHFFLTAGLFFGIYVIVTALSLPAAGIMTIVGGAVFGLGWGLVLVSFASSIGATLAFMLARTILHDYVQARFGDYLKPIYAGVEKDGRFYLFTMRLIPAFPFFVINVLMALTPMKTRDFYWVSQLGMLFGTVIYVNVGAQLGQVTEIGDVLSLQLWSAFILLAIAPWIARAIVKAYRARKALWAFSKPATYDVNLVVIGAGAAGLVTSLIASLVKARVVLIEKHLMGGDCLNTGCVPSKALIRSASVRHLIARAKDFGLAANAPEVDFGAVMQRVRDIIKQIEPHDSVERYTAMGVECINGEASINSPWSVTVNGKEITTRNIVLATGARPLVPDIPGLQDTGFVTSDTVWELTVLPERLLVIGGGPIGCEMTQAFARLGSRVTQVDKGEHILPREDKDVARVVQETFIAEGIDVICNSRVVRFEQHDARKFAVLHTESGGEQKVEFDQVLLALGRKANVEGFGLEKLGLALDRDGTLKVDEYLQTSIPNIYACGDVAGPYQFTHMASHHAWYASINTLFSGFRRFRVNYSVVPWATYIDPEVARVGLNEKDAKEKNISVEVTRYDISDLDRAITDSEAFGFVKILTPPGKDKILGVTIVGYHAAELISEFVFAMTHGLGLKKIMGTIHIYPTLTESNKFAASEWRKKHAPEWVYPWLKKFHRWRRG